MKKLKSIIIITFGRDKELYETLKDICRYRDNDLEILILDNNIENIRKNKICKILNENKMKYFYYHEGYNYGVALGRNYLIKKAKGDIIITLDDDIEILDINKLIKKTEEYFEKDERLGCLAFSIKNYYTRKSLRHEIPHGNKKLDFQKNLETYYFIGAGHAIKSEVYNSCGIYPENLGKYGGEESDLSFRIIEKYKILYVADIEIFHKISPNGRMPKKEENFLRYCNKMKIVKKYMPKKNIFANFIIWSLMFLVKEKDIKGVYKVKKEMDKIKRKTLKKDTLIKLKKIKARLYY